MEKIRLTHYIRIELLVGIVLLSLAWVDISSTFLNIILGFTLYYFLFRYILLLLIGKEISGRQKKYLMNRFNIFLVIHGFLFLLQLVYIDFDFFPGLGDWDRYDAGGRLFANGSTINEIMKAIPSLGGGLSYVTLVGVIYYLFNGSVFMAVSINVFLIVCSSIALYILIFNIFGHRIARNSMYISALFPVFIVAEAALWKECLVFFVFLAASLVSYRATHRPKLSMFTILCLLLVILYHTRFIYVISIVSCILYYYVSQKGLIKKLATLIIVTGVVVSFFFGMVGYGQYRKGSARDLMFGQGISVTDKEGGSFNYQVRFDNPFQLVKIVGNHAFYYLDRIPKYWLNGLTLSRVFYAPFLSAKFVVGSRPLMDIMVYLSSLFLWLCLFCCLSGLKEMAKRMRETCIIWMPLILIPLILSVVSGNVRHMLGIKYFAITAICVGMAKRRKWEDYYILSFVLSFSLVVAVNINTIVVKSILVAFGLIGSCAVALYLLMQSSIFRARFIGPIIKRGLKSPIGVTNRSK